MMGRAMLRAGAFALAALGAPAVGADEPFSTCEAWVNDTLFGAFDPKERLVVYTIKPNTRIQGFRKGAGADLGRDVFGTFTFPGKDGKPQSVLVMGYSDKYLQFFLPAEYEAELEICSERRGDEEGACDVRKGIESGFIEIKEFTVHRSFVKNLSCSKVADGLKTDDVVAGKGEDKEACPERDDDHWKCRPKTPVKKDKPVGPLIPPDKEAEGDGKPVPPKDKEKPGPLADLGLEPGKTPAKKEPKKRETGLADLVTDKDDKDKKEKKGSLTDLTGGGDGGKVPVGDEKKEKKGSLTDLTDRKIEDGDAADDAKKPEGGDAAGGDKLANVDKDKIHTPKPRPGDRDNKRVDARTPALASGKVCQVRDVDGNLVFKPRDVTASDGTPAMFFAGLRGSSTEAKLYEILSPSDVFETERTFKLGTASGKVIPVNAVVRWKPAGGSDADGEALISAKDLGAAATPKAAVDPSLPAINILVFGGDSETAYANLGAIEEALRGLDDGRYRLNVVFYRLARNGKFVAAKTYPGLRELVAATPPSDKTPPWVNLRDEQVKPYLDEIVQRVRTSGIDRIDHIFVLKGAYSVPTSATKDTEDFIKSLAAIPAINNGFYDHFLTVIAARGTDFSHGFMAQPLTDAKQRFYYEKEHVKAERKKAGKDPQLVTAKEASSLATALNTRFLDFTKGEVVPAPDGGPAPDDENSAVSAKDVFETMGIVAEPDTLGRMDDSANSQLLLYKAWKSDAEGPKSALTGERYVKDNTLTPNISLLSEILPDDAAYSKPEVQRSVALVTPFWLRRPIRTMSARELAQAFEKLEKLRGVLTDVLDNVGRKCTLIYLPVTPDYTAIDAGKPKE